ncbi:MAG: response regulator transcription factor [Pontibacter sp.]|nr:response regulator transcription factor [Pontibacter sp.]
MIRLILATDQGLVRGGIKALLESEGVTVTAEVATAEELLSRLAHSSADAVVLDTNLSGTDAAKVIKLLKEQYVTIKVLALSTSGDESKAYQLVKPGASGSIPKNAGREELQLAIKVIKGSFSSDNLNHSYRNEVVPEATEEGTRVQRNLSRRELEVLNLISDGYTNAEIAQMLFTSKRTIETHRQNLLEKTQTKNTASLIKYAVLNGIIC